MEPSFFGAFRADPSIFLLILFVAIAACLIAAIAIVRRKRLVALLALFCVVANLFLGAFGTVKLRGYAEAVSQGQGLSEKDRDRLRESHLSESWYPLQTASFSGALPLVLGLVGLLLTRKRTA